ncbi:MAG: ROK family protein [Gemmataceae bacterium]|nr:ROK family protein [Gemmataceae bacterium]
MSANQILAGIDLGGTTITAGLGDLNGNILLQRSIPTLSENGPEDVLCRMASLVKNLAQEAGYKPSALGIGIPGLVDPTLGKTLFLPNMHTQWRGVCVREILENSLGYSVRILNDVRTATLGEMKFGLGKNVSNMVFFSLGTGIGGGIVIGGKLLLGPLGSAGEIGHQTILPNGPYCGCGNQGCLEALCSGPAIIAEGVRLFKSGQAPKLVHICANDISNVSPETMAQAAKEGDESISAGIYHIATLLGIGVANMVTSLHPELVVLGGGVSKMGDLLLVPVRKVVKQRVRMFPVDDVRIELSSVGEGAGLLGAIALADFKNLGVGTDELHL